MHQSTASTVIVRLTILCLLALSSVAVTFAQPEQPDLTIDAATRTQVVDGILKRLNDSYVFPDVAKKMEQSIRERVAKKEYEQITSAAQPNSSAYSAARAAGVLAANPQPWAASSPNTGVSPSV